MSDYESPIETVDVAIFTVRGGRLCVLLARRAKDPYAGVFALPGGYIHPEEDDDVAATARRVLRDKIGLAAPYLEQLYTFSGKFRDPRGWSSSVAHYAVVPEALVGGALGDDVRLVPVDELPALPFDHNDMVAMAVRRIRGKSSYSSLPTFLLPEEFTVDELHAVYQQVLGVDLPKPTFRRKIEAQGIIVPVEGKMRVGPHRPAQMYRASHDTLREFDQAL